MTNNDIKIIKETIKERQELLTTCAALQDEVRKEIAAAKKMLEQKKLNNSITVRLHGVYQLRNDKIAYCYEIKNYTAHLYVGGPYNDVIVNMAGGQIGFKSRYTGCIYLSDNPNWSIRRIYKKKYDKENKD